MKIDGTKHEKLFALTIFLVAMIMKHAWIGLVMFYELVSLIFCKDLLISYCFGVRSEKRSDRDTERAKQGNGQFM